MEKHLTIHLEEPNTLSNFLSEEEMAHLVSLKITGVIGSDDIDDVLDDLCTVWGEYDDDDHFIPDLGSAPALRHLDLGEATLFAGDALPYFGFHAQLETFILPKGLEAVCFEGTGFCETETLTKIVLPEGLKTVDGFHECPNLSNVVLPDSVETIKSFAFAQCTSITSIRIPAATKEMDGSCFAGCSISAFEIITVR